MRIDVRKSFLKQYRKLSKPSQERVANAMKIFQQNPFDERLKNHALVGEAKGKRSMSAGFDLRIIFTVEGDYIIVVMIAVGTHNQIY